MGGEPHVRSFTSAELAAMPVTSQGFDTLPFPSEVGIERVAPPALPVAMRRTGAEPCPRALGLHLRRAGVLAVALGRAEVPPLVRGELLALSPAEWPAALPAALPEARTRQSRAAGMAAASE